MPKQPLVSIGLIAYNRANIISKSINSLLSQSYKNIELIISDDDSSDKTAEICQRYLKKNKKIRFFRQRKNLGLARNSNFVLSKAKGKYFVWASDDDTWHKDYVNTLVSMLEKNNQAVLAVSNFYLYNGKIKQYANYQYDEISSGLKLIIDYLLKSSLLVWGMFRTKKLKQIRGFHIDDRPFFHKGSDHVTVFKALLCGDLLYSNKVLFYKKDSGQALNRFQKLSELDLSSNIIFKIKRYLLYPINFSFDFYYLLKYNFLSKLILIKKIIVTFGILIWYFKVILQFCLECILGFFSLLFGVFKKVYFPKVRQTSK